MISILEMLNENIKKSSKPSYSKIANQLLKDYSHGIFRPEKQLSKLCFVSESTITNFSQSLGYSGYREFVVKFKLEYENCFPNAIFQNFDSIITKFEIFTDIISKNYEFIFNFAREIKNNKSIVIVSSYQSESEVSVFVQELNLLNFTKISLIRLSNIGRFNGFFELYKNFDVALLMFTGIDVKTIYQVYEEALELSKIKIYTISTKNKLGYLKNEDNCLLINTAPSLTSILYRKIIYNLIFSEILMNL